MGKKTDIRNIINSKKVENNSWDVKYIEKKPNEFGLYLYLSLEIKKFIKKFLKNNELKLYKYKINFSESELKIFLSYFKSSNIKKLVYKSFRLKKTVRFIKTCSTKKLVQLETVLKKFLLKYGYYKKLSISKKKSLKLLNYSAKNNNSPFNRFIEIIKTDKFFKNNNIKTLVYLLKKQLIENNYPFLKLRKIKNNINYFYNKYLFKKIYKYYLSEYLLKSKLKLRIKKVSLQKLNTEGSLFLKNYISYLILKNNALFKKIDLKDYLDYLKIKKYKSLKAIKINNFLENFVESLKIFLDNKLNVKISFHSINKDIYYFLTFHQRQLIKKISVQLRRFKDFKFFNEGINLIFFTVTKRNSSELLSQFLAQQLKSKKKHNSFFQFLEQLLALLFRNKVSNIKSLKIQIKGRLNNSARSKKKVIFLGSRMPLMTLDSNINYSESTAYGPNGTFGVKVWIYESNF